MLCVRGVVRLIKSSWIIEFHLEPLSLSPWQPAPWGTQTHTRSDYNITTCNTNKNKSTAGTHTIAWLACVRVCALVCCCRTKAPNGLCLSSVQTGHSVQLMFYSCFLSVCDHAYIYIYIYNMYFHLAWVSMDNGKYQYSKYPESNITDSFWSCDIIGVKWSLFYYHQKYFFLWDKFIAYKNFIHKYSRAWIVLHMIIGKKPLCT